MSTEAAYEDLLDALARSGCAICRLATRRADRFLASYIYEHVNDVDLRAQIRSSRGFCEPHGEQFLEKLDALAVAITYRDILNSIVRELDDGSLDETNSSTRPRSHSLFQGSAFVGTCVGILTGTVIVLLTSRGSFGFLAGFGVVVLPLAVFIGGACLTLALRRSRKSALFRNRYNKLIVASECLVCLAEKAATERTLDVLVQHVTSDKLAEALSHGDPLCLAHTQGALSRSRKLPALISRQRGGWEDLRDLLLEFIRKSDHNHRWEDLTDAERAAIVNSVRTVTGTRTRPADDASAETRKMRRGGTNARRAP